MEVGTVGSMELVFFFIIVIVVVGPRRILRGWRRIKEWVKNGFRRAGRSKTARKGRGVLRGLGRMTAYYRNAPRRTEEDAPSQETGE